MSIHDHISEEIKNNPIVLYMKGNADRPMCGFSATVVHILKRFNLPFKDVNILENQELREAIKVFSNWPTIPQLYVKEEFIGGCDIVKEMFESGELEALFQSKGLI
jgi:monothiol glutaredoxin